MKHIYVPTNRRCHRCHSIVFESDLEGYPFVCLDCDENMFSFETYIDEDDKKE